MVIAALRYGYLSFCCLGGAREDDGVIAAGVYCVPVSKCLQSYNCITEGPQQEVSDRKLFSQSLADVLELKNKKWKDIYYSNTSQMQCAKSIGALEESF